MLAAQKDAREVDVLHALPRLQVGLERRAVVGRRDPRVVEQHVEAPEGVHDVVEHLDHAALVRDVDLQRELARRVLVQIHTAHARALAREQLSGRGADAPRGAGDEADLPVEAAAHVA